MFIVLTLEQQMLFYYAYHMKMWVEKDKIFIDNPEKSGNFSYINNIVLRGS
jgi:hypothetical protein